MPTAINHIVAVAGPDRASPMTQEMAREVGRCVMRHGFHLLVGGTGPVAHACCEGAQEEKTNLRRRGRFVGEAPVVMAMLAGTRKDEAPAELDLVLTTGLGSALQAAVCASCDALVAVEGGANALTHVALAWDLNKPIVLISPGGSTLEHLVGEKMDPQREDMILAADSAERALELIADRLRGTAVLPRGG